MNLFPKYGIDCLRFPLLIVLNKFLCHFLTLYTCLDVFDIQEISGQI
ncbi:hypothetical protein LEP1GSC172_2432 [Leptospira noguchii]|uniref:Uncharacterized protein n=1 Tax=Leptospira noguchii TaxID=28182 RepID=M6VGH2_9LEPT|nr:hypothetical protein LEP1GSC172_2432 [Leptospira noguchii]